jgi:hypothetical protein
MILIKSAKMCFLTSQLRSEYLSYRYTWILENNLCTAYSIQYDGKKVEIEKNSKIYPVKKTNANNTTATKKHNVYLQK